MSTKYDVNPGLECYTYMVDLFVPVGFFEKGATLIENMPFYDYSIIMRTLLSACCQNWAHVNVGR